MNSRRSRTRIGEGLYRDRFGLAATVKVGRIQREKRWPHGTATDTLRRWRVQMRAELETARATGKVVTGTLKADGDRFLERKKGRESFKADRSHLRAWYPRLGGQLRHTITLAAVELLVSDWLSAKVAARTIRHRCRVLRECYLTLDGPKASTPVDGMKLPKIPASQPVAVPLKTIRTVAENLRKAGKLVEYARLVVRATTGQRPVQIMRATPADVDFKRKIWFVRQAKQGMPVPLPLNTEAVAAWKYFAKANAWGPFDTTREAQIWREHGWPAGLRPKALRSTFAIDLLLGGADLGDVQGLLGHRQIQTTREHYAPILAARLRRVTASRFLKLGVPAVVPAKRASR